MMELAQESLADRVALLHMSSLSQHEIYGNGCTFPFTVDLQALKERTKINTPADMQEMYRRIWMGSMPGLLSGRYTDRDVFYSSYLQTYIDRDVSDLVDLTDKLIFRDFIRAAACRAGQMLNIHSITQDVGAFDSTANRLVSRLYRSACLGDRAPAAFNQLRRVSIQIPSSLATSRLGRSCPMTMRMAPALNASS